MKRIADARREPWAEPAGVQVKSGDRLCGGELDGGQSVTGNLGGQFVDREFAEIVGSDTEFHWERHDG
jgi:hypothetical protein